MFYSFLSYFFFFNDTATTEIYTLSLHDALPISARSGGSLFNIDVWLKKAIENDFVPGPRLAASGREICGVGGLMDRSEEHTSELQSQSNLVCRLLLEKKKKKN